MAMFTYNVCVLIVVVYCEMSNIAPLIARPLSYVKYAPPDAVIPVPPPNCGPCPNVDPYPL